MKILFFIFLQILNIPLPLVAQTIPNSNFEIWSSNSKGIPQPLNWETQNEPGIIYVEPFPGHTGNYSACLNIRWDYMLRKYCGATLKSEFKILDPAKFQYIEGYFKGKSENIDSLIIEVVLFCENSMIGSGILKVLDNSNNWNNFKVPIQYYSEVLPDRAYISISINPVNGSHSRSSYCIDDLLISFIEFKYLTIPNKQQSIEINRV